MFDNANIFDPGGGQSDDIEALQSDVMRFLAILAICLMVIFALVQAIPLKSDEGKPSMVDPLEQRLESLKNRIAALSRREQVLRNIVQANQAILEKMHIDATVLRKELGNVRNELKQEEKRLASLKSEVKEKQKRNVLDQKAIQVINNRIDERNRALDSLETKAEKLKKKVKIDGIDPIIPHPKNEVVGFSIKFKSEEVMIRLIQEKRITFYAGLKGNYWKFSVSGAQIQLTRRPEGRLLAYRMRPETLPEALKEVASRKLVSFSREGINYFVRFSPDILEDIRNRMQGARGGMLIVNAQGNVNLTK